jgi:hypothetical protein
VLLVIFLVMSAPKPSIVESAQEFIDDTASLLEKEGYELGDEPVMSR